MVKERQKASVEKDECLAEILAIPAKLPDLLTNVFSGLVSGMSALGVAERLVTEQRRGKANRVKKASEKASRRRRH